MNTYYIQLGGKTYQCRNDNGNREVFYDGQFRSCEDFVGWLIDNGEMEAVIELINFGYKKVSEELSQ